MCFVLSCLSSSPRRRIDDRACVNRRDRCLENVDAFEEERTLLGKEDRKSLVRSDHELIGLNLREIRIDCQVERDSANWE